MSANHTRKLVRVRIDMVLEYDDPRAPNPKLDPVVLALVDAAKADGWLDGGTVSFTCEGEAARKGESDHYSEMLRQYEHMTAELRQS